MSDRIARPHGLLLVFGLPAAWLIALALAVCALLQAERILDEVDGLAKRLPHSYGFTVMAISPSGTWVAFRRVNELGYDLCVFNRSTEQQRCLFRGKGIITGARFSPNSRYVGFYHDTTGRGLYELWIADLQHSARPLFSAAHFSGGIQIFQFSQASDAVFYLPLIDISRQISGMRLSDGTPIEIAAPPEAPIDVAPPVDGTRGRLFWVGESKSLYVHSLGSTTHDRISLPGFQIDRVYPERSAHILTKARNRASQATVFLQVNAHSTSGRLTSKVVELPEGVEVADFYPGPRTKLAFTFREGRSVGIGIPDPRDPSRFSRVTILGNASGVATPIAWSPDESILYFTWSNHATPPALYRMSLPADGVTGRVSAERVFPPPNALWSMEPYQMKISETNLQVGGDTSMPILQLSPICGDKKVRESLVYVHPWGGSAVDKWSPLFAFANSLGWEVVAPTLSSLGVGNETETSQDAHRRHHTEVSALLANVRSRFSDSHPIVIAGESYGGTIAQSRPFSAPPCSASSTLVAPWSHT